MKFSSASVLAACIPAISARFIESVEVNNVVLEPKEESFLVETAPGKTKWVTEEDKWEMRRVWIPPPASPVPSSGRHVQDADSLSLSHT